MINTVFGPMDEPTLDKTATVLSDDEDKTVERIEYRLKEHLPHDGKDHPAGTLVHKYDQVKIKRVTTIFGVKMDVGVLDKHIEVTDNEKEFTQCPEYRLREPYEHDGLTRNGDDPPLSAGTYPVGVMVHRSVHVQLKKNVFAEAAAAAFG